MKKNLFLFIFLTFSIVYCQDIQIKKDVVYVDGKECLKTSGDASNVSFLDLNGNEIIFLKFIHNSKYGALYNKITFLDQNISFTSKSYIFNKKILMKKLLNDKTLNNCQLDDEKVGKFAIKYDENVEN